MTKDDIKGYMAFIGALGRVMHRLDTEPRRKLFEQAKEAAPTHIAKTLSVRGIKRTFGLSSDHRKKISASTKNRWIIRKAQHD